MSGEGLFELSERIGIRASDIVAATEAEVARRCLSASHDQIVEAHRIGQIASRAQGSAMPRAARRKKAPMSISTRDKLIELSLQWQEKYRTPVAAKR